MSPAPAVAFLIRRHGFRHRFDLWRSFSSQTLTLDSSNVGSTSKGAAAGRVVPSLLVPSQRNPQTCRLYSLTKFTDYGGRDRNSLKLEREIHLPETNAFDKALCIGSSPAGFLFFTAKMNPPSDIFALNPLTGAHLPLPSAPATLRLLPYSVGDAKSLLSPSRDIVVLNRIHFADFALLGGGGGNYEEEDGGCWRPLPDSFGYMHDFIFHKGFLCAVDHKRRLSFLDVNDLRPLSSAVSGDVRPPLRFVDDPLCHSWLVESPDGEDLFLVCRHEEKFCIYPHSFKVFKLNRNNNWKRVKSIGDTAIFVGINQPLSLSAADFPDTLRPNSIYFTESRKMASEADSCFVQKTGVFCLDDERRIQIFTEPMDDEEVLIEPVRAPHLWFTPITTP